MWYNDLKLYIMFVIVMQLMQKSELNGFDLFNNYRLYIDKRISYCIYVKEDKLRLENNTKRKRDYVRQNKKL